MLISRLINRMLTERDNQTHCPFRVGGAGIVLVYHVAVVWMVVGQHVAIDMAQMGLYIQHMCTLIGVGALSVGAKAVMKADAPTP